MRLTLRTLLAYLDDILEPEQTRELGKKIEASPVAQQLVRRIRDVVRRRRLMAPTLHGPESGLDPNIVAEYLDNQLTPAQVAQTERVLLNSEIHLAETAATHQILTLVLGEPVDVLPESRKRMYALGPVPAQEQLSVAEQNHDSGSGNGNGHATAVTRSVAAGDASGQTQQATAAATVAADTNASSLAPMLTTRERSSLPLVVVVLLIGSWIALLASDPGSRATRDTKPTKALAAAGDQARAAAPAADAAQPHDEVAPPPPTADDGAPAATNLVADAAAGVSEPIVVSATQPGDEKPASAGIDAPPPPDAPDTVHTLPDTTEPSVVSADNTPQAPAGAAIESAVEPPASSDTPTATSEPPVIVDLAPPQPTVSDLPPPGETTTEPAAEPKLPATDTDTVTSEAVPPNPQTPTATPGAEPAPPALTEASEAPTPADATAPTVPPAAATAASDVEKPTPAEATRQTRLRYATDDGVLLVYRAGQGWFTARPGDEFGIDDRLATPAPLVSAFEVSGEPLQIHLAADSRMRILAPSDPSKAAVALQLELGRIVLSRIVSADQPASEPIRVQLRVHDRDWLIELPASEARVGFDVTPVPPVRLEKTYDGFPYKVWAAGSRGAVRIHPPEGEPREIGAEDTVALAGPGPGEVLVEPGTTIEQFLVQKDPALLWMSGPTAPTDKRDAMRFAREFDPSDPVSDTMPSLVTHERAWMSRRAVQCLALTEDYRALVRSLNVAEHEEAVEAAIRGLRHWLPLDPENGPRLREALEQEFTADEAEILYRLLWGFDEEHGRDPRTSQELVSWLSHDRLAIRRLAYFHILRLTGQQDEYRLLMSDDRMQSFRKRWERHLERHKALLETTAD